jgi:hypothetical protein
MSGRGFRSPARLAAWLGCVALAGCAVVGPESRTFVGPVTVVSHHSVCIGGPNASGECFAKDQLTRHLQVTDCVRVTYRRDDSAAHATLTDVEHLVAGDHPADCLRQ